MPRVNRIPADIPQLPQQRVRPVQARSRKKIDAILDATADLLQRYGIDAVTTLAIAEKAGVPPATVYHYFENRLAIFAALARRIIDAVDTNLLPILAEKLAAPVPEFRAILQGLFDAYSQAPGYVPVLTAMRAEPALQALVRESNQRSADFLATVLQRRTQLSPERAARVAWIISESCEIVLEQALISNAPEADALLDEQSTMVEVLFLYYAQV
jgi:AcrR family transcriptional regulator